MDLRYRPLLNPVLDFLFLGGLSILIIPFTILIPESHVEWIGIIASGAIVWAFLLDFPHYALSYQLFYITHRKKLFSSWPWIFIGVVWPLLLLVFLSVCYAIGSIRDIGYIIALSIILLGGHYCLQVYRLVDLLGRRAQYILNRGQRRALALNLMGLWLLTLTVDARRPMNFVYFTVKYPFQMLPPEFSAWIYGFVLLTMGMLILESVLRFKKEFSPPPKMMWVPVLALYFWFVPLLNSVFILVLVPIFHALQYLVMAVAFKKNQLKASVSADQVTNKLTVFLLAAFFSGALFLEIIPRSLDILITFSTVNMTIFLALFNAFFNLQHYFIDALLWRPGSAEFEKYLVP